MGEQREEMIWGLGVWGKDEKIKHSIIFLQVYVWKKLKRSTTIRVIQNQKKMIWGIFFFFL